MFIYDLSIFLTSTAFVPTNAKYGIPLSRYTVFLQNCPLGYAPKSSLLFAVGLLFHPIQMICRDHIFKIIEYQHSVCAALPCVF